MRVSRIKEAGPAHYHIMSRIVDRQMLMNPSEGVIEFRGCWV